ncbi:MarR family winged helix-turn-helix transcriptional regulator [Intestinimonas massiliensis (ex Afouda et al. 2020)]|uniref:MarR family winged helix-turn-helix transcriptional regulator n=1 Tax=Intestinimonas massiliensis (ex Afouda et al. 2020) TaxID=1673721 RepID=UPI00103181FB|nr:MarR family transcriptional regulator [Intestinimonas massiliensis (ex Afouda et al. 2020)]
MDQSFHYLLMAAQGLFQRAVMGELSKAGLTTGQPKVLDYLGLHDGSIQKQIAAGCQIDPATLTGLLGRMEEKGLIERRSQDGDRRSLYVYLTAEGWEKQKLVRAAMGRMEEQVLDSLDQSQRDALKAGLLQVCLSLTEDKEALQ